MIRGMHLSTKFLALASAVFLLSPVLAHADDRSDCAAGAGSLLTGVVIAKPAFAKGRPLRGVPLSHTHIRIRSDADGKTYDVAADDVFAAGYDPRRSEVPAPLSSIGVGQHLEACGLPFPGGIHWVHTNCGDTPTAADPNGWLKVIDASGIAGPNLEGSQTYCDLWPRGSAAPRHGRRHRTPRSV